jgi:ectoine hydroxylase-related dioxygenase (phytanoyl-CoA dioxygenase family)
MLVAYPQPDTPFSFWQHVDIQYRLTDFQAVPRKIICSFFLWLTDVDERRAPMMLRPGSHLLIAGMRQHDPDWKDDPPRVAPVPLERLPPLPYSDPIPLTAKAGQVSVLTTAAVHGASVNVDSEPRKNLVITFTAAGVKIGLPPHEEAQKQEYNGELRMRLRPDRAHIIP